MGHGEGLPGWPMFSKVEFHESMIFWKGGRVLLFCSKQRNSNPFHRSVIPEGTFQHLDVQRHFQHAGCEDAWNHVNIKFSATVLYLLSPLLPPLLSHLPPHWKENINHSRQPGGGMWTGGCDIYWMTVYFLRNF